MHIRLVSTSHGWPVPVREKCFIGELRPAAMYGAATRGAATRGATTRSWLGPGAAPPAMGEAPGPGDVGLSARVAHAEQFRREP